MADHRSKRHTIFAILVSFVAAPFAASQQAGLDSPYSPPKSAILISAITIEGELPINRDIVLGNVPSPARLTYRIDVKNVSPRPVDLNLIETSCGCLAAVPDARAIPSQAVVPVYIELKSDLHGPFRRSVKFRNAMGAGNDIKIELSGKSVPWIEVSPTSLLYDGKSPLSQEIEFTSQIARLKTDFIDLRIINAPDARFADAVTNDGTVVKTLRIGEVEWGEGEASRDVIVEASLTEAGRKAIPNASNFTIPLKLENPNAIIVRPSAITGVRSKEGTMTFRVVLGGSRTAVAMLEAGNVAPVLEFCESKYEKPLAIAAIKLIGSDFAIVNLIAEVDDQRMQGKSKLKVLKRESLQCIGTTDVSPSTWNR